MATDADIAAGEALLRRRAARLDGADAGRAWSPLERRDWALVDRAARRMCGRRLGALSDEIVQVALVKAATHLDGLRASDGRGAFAWLRRVCRSAEMDVHRSEKPMRRTVEFDEEHVGARAEADGAGASGAGSWSSTPPPDGDGEAELRLFLDSLMARAEQSAESKHRSLGRQSKAVLQARVAIDRHVHELGVAELRATLPHAESVSHAAIYKWVERGRDETLLPVLEAWRAEGPADGTMRRQIELLLDLLKKTRRADVGTPRLARRKPRARTGGR